MSNKQVAIKKAIKAIIAAKEAIQEAQKQMTDDDWQAAQSISVNLTAGVFGLRRLQESDN